MNVQWLYQPGQVSELLDTNWCWDSESNIKRCGYNTLSLPDALIDILDTWSVVDDELRWDTKAR